MTIIDMPDEPWRPDRRKTALEKLQEEIERPLNQWNNMQRQLQQWEDMQRPLKQWEEMQRVLSPLRQLDDMQKILGGQSLAQQIREAERHTLQRHLREIVAQSVTPKHVQDLLDHSSAALQAQRLVEQYLPKYQLGVTSDAVHAARLAADLNVLSDIVNTQERALAATKQQEWFKRLQLHATGGISLADLSRHYEQINPALTAFEEAQKTLNSLASSFLVTESNVVELGEDEVQEAQRTTLVIAQAAAEEPDLQAAVVQIVAAIEAQNNPSLKLMLWIFFKKIMDWIIAGIIGAIISQHMPQTPPPSPQQAIKSLKVVARANIDSPTVLNDYRIVAAKELSVRQNPKARSPVIGIVRSGRVVKLLKKDRDFSLVLWKDVEAGMELQGWVFNRYLEKFN